MLTLSPRRKDIARRRSEGVTLKKFVRGKRNRETPTSNKTLARTAAYHDKSFQPMAYQGPPMSRHLLNWVNFHTSSEGPMGMHDYVTHMDVPFATDGVIGRLGRNLFTLGHNNSSIVAIRISYASTDRMSWRGWKMLIILLCNNSSIRELYLKGCHGQMTSSYFFSFLSETQLRLLSLHEVVLTELQVAALEALMKKSKHLNKLTLREVGVIAQGYEGLVTAVAAGLVENMSLSSLTIQYCEVFSGSAMALAQALTINTRLKELVLSAVNVGGDIAGVMAILTTLQNGGNTTLSVLSISTMDVTLPSMDGGLEIGRILPRITNLKRFEIENCEHEENDASLYCQAILAGVMETVNENEVCMARHTALTVVLKFGCIHAEETINYFCGKGYKAFLCFRQEQQHTPASYWPYVLAEVNMKNQRELVLRGYRVRNDLIFHHLKQNPNLYASGLIQQREEAEEGN